MSRFLRGGKQPKSEDAPATQQSVYEGRNLAPEVEDADWTPIGEIIGGQFIPAAPRAPWEPAPGGWVPIEQYRPFGR